MADFEFRSLPFRQALLYLRRKLNLPSRIWLNVLREENDWAFQVAGAMKAELLGGLREAVDKAIEQGTTLEDFRKDFDRIVQQQGWNYRGSRGWRTRVIYQTNLRTAHAAGRYQQMDSDRVKARRPYRQYRHGGSQEPRELHVTRAPKGWNGLVLRAGDPWWDVHYPPNDWGCSCFVVTLSDADLERLGLAVDEPPDRGTYEWVNPETGEVEDIPVGVGPEWTYAPGASKREDRERIFRGMLSRMDADLRAQVEDAIRRQSSSASPLTD